MGGGGGGLPACRALGLATRRCRSSSVCVCTGWGPMVFLLIYVVASHRNARAHADACTRTRGTHARVRPSIPRTRTRTRTRTHAPAAPPGSASVRSRALRSPKHVLAKQRTRFGSDARPSVSSDPPGSRTHSAHAVVSMRATPGQQLRCAKERWKGRTSGCLLNLHSARPWRSSPETCARQCLRSGATRACRRGRQQAARGGARPPQVCAARGALAAGMTAAVMGGGLHARGGQDQARPMPGLACATPYVCVSRTGIRPRGSACSVVPGQRGNGSRTL